MPGTGLFDDLLGDTAPTPAPAPVSLIDQGRAAPSGLFDDLQPPPDTYHRDRLTAYLADPATKRYGIDQRTLESLQRNADNEVSAQDPMTAQDAARREAFNRANPRAAQPDDQHIGVDQRGVIQKGVDLMHGGLLGAKSGAYGSLADIDSALNAIHISPLDLENATPEEASASIAAGSRPLLSDETAQNMHDLAKDAARPVPRSGLTGLVAGASEMAAGSAAYMNPVLAPIQAAGAGRRAVLETTGDGLLASGDQLKADVVGVISGLGAIVAPGGGKVVGESLSRSAPEILRSGAHGAAGAAAYTLPQPLATAAVAGNDQRLQEQAREGLDAAPAAAATITGLGFIPPLIARAVRPSGSMYLPPEANPSNYEGQTTGNNVSGLPPEEIKRTQSLWKDYENKPSDQKITPATELAGRPGELFRDIDPGVLRYKDTQPQGDPANLRKPEVVEQQKTEAGLPPIDTTMADTAVDHAPVAENIFDSQQTGAKLGGFFDDLEKQAQEGTLVPEAKGPDQPWRRPGVSTPEQIKEIREKLAEAQVPMPKRDTYDTPGAGLEPTESSPKENLPNAVPERSAPNDGVVAREGSATAAEQPPAPVVGQPPSREKSATTEDTFGSPVGEHTPGDLVEVYIPATKKTLRAQVEKTYPDGTLRLKTENGNILPRVAGHRVTKVKEVGDVAGSGGRGGRASTDERPQPPVPQEPVERVPTVVRTETVPPAAEPVVRPKDRASNRPVESAAPTPEAKPREIPQVDPDAKTTETLSGADRVSERYIERSGKTARELHGEADQIESDSEKLARRLFAGHPEAERLTNKYKADRLTEGDVEKAYPHLDFNEHDRRFGQLWKVESPRDLRKFADKVDLMESSESPQEAGRMLGRRIYDVSRAMRKNPRDWSPDEAEAAALYRAAQRVAKEKGWNPDIVSEQMGVGAEQIGHKRGDLEDLRSNTMESIAGREGKGNVTRNSNDDFTNLPGNGGESAQHSPRRELGDAEHVQHAPGAAPGAATAAGRIKVAPLPGGTDKKTKDILLNLQDAIGKPVRIGRIDHPNALGAYYPGTSKTNIRYHNDIDTTAHESAHALDDEYGIVGDWAGKPSSPFDDELSKFWKYGSEPPNGVPANKAQTYRRAEGVAEYIRAAILNPAAARAAAPKFSAYLKQKIPGKVREALNNFSGDVRRWAGQGSLERTAANIRDIGGAKQGGVLGKLRDTLRTEHGELFKYGFLDRAKEEIQDALWPAIKAVRALKGLRGDVSPENDPEALMRVVGGHNDAMGQILDHGPFDLNGKVRAGIDGGADWLLDWADTSSKESINRDSLMAAAVGISERVGDEAEKIQRIASASPGGVTPEVRDRMSRLSGAGGGIFSDVKEARRALVEFDRMPAADKSRIKEGVRRLRAWSEATLQHLVDTGILSKERFAAIKKANPHYIDMHRVMDDEKIGSSLEAFKGSMRQIDNPFVNALAQTDRAYKSGSRNLALRKFRDMLTSGRSMYEGKVTPYEGIGRKMPESEGSGTKIFVDGNPERWQFQPDIQRALDGWGEVEQVGRLDQLLRIPGQILRAGVTHSPPFLIRNAFRDAVNRGIISESNSKPWDIFSKINKDDLAAYRRSGGGQAGHYLSDKVDYHRELAKRVRELAGDKSTILGLPGKALGAWGSLSKGSELIGRMAEFRAARNKGLAQGMSERSANVYAASQARGLLDYAIAGSFIKKVARYVPFLNAQIQGLHRSYSAVKNNPGTFAAKWSAYVLSTSLAFKGLQAASENQQDTEDYRQLPAWRKDLFWNLKIGSRWLSLPKPFELGALAAPIERTIDKVRGDKHAFDGVTGSMVKSIMPIDDGTLAGPLRATVEGFANWDFFRDTHIVPPHEEGEDVSLRKGSDHASALGKALQGLLGIDSRQVDHWIRGTLGTAGTMALSASDLGSDRGTLDSELSSFLGMTTATPMRGSRDVEWVMKEAARRNEMQRKPIKGLSNLIRLAITAPPAEREKKAQEARRVATGLRAVYEQREPIKSRNAAAK